MDTFTRVHKPDIQDKIDEFIEQLKPIKTELHKNHSLDQENVLLVKDAFGNKFPDIICDILCLNDIECDKLYDDIQLCFTRDVIEYIMFIKSPFN